MDIRSCQPLSFPRNSNTILKSQGHLFFIFFASAYASPSTCQILAWLLPKTPRLKKKPPTNKNKIEPVYNPQRNPIAALTNSNITNTSHLSTNERWALSVLLIVFSNFRYITSRLNGTATNSVFFTSLFRYLKYAVFEIRCDDGSRRLSVRCSSFVDHH